MAGVYEGENPYIFISYSHRDEYRITPIIKEMQDRGFRVWYDAGIAPGVEWAKNIAIRVGQCDVFLCFVSDYYIESQNCLDEFSAAKSKNKQILTVYLDSNVISHEGFEFQTRRFQKIHYFLNPTPESFTNEISSSEIAQPCREGATRTYTTESSAKPKSSVNESPELISVFATWNKRIKWIGIILLILCNITCIHFLSEMSYAGTGGFWIFINLIFPYAIVFAINKCMFIALHYGMLTKNFVGESAKKMLSDSETIFWGVSVIGVVLAIFIEAANLYVDSGYIWRLLISILYNIIPCFISVVGYLYMDGFKKQ